MTAFPRLSPSITSGLLICNILLLCSTTYLLYDKYKPVGRIKYLHPGEPAGSFEAVTSEGMPASFSFSAAEKPTLLFVFSTTCPVCEATIPQWNRLASGKNDVQIVGISTDGADLTIPYIFAREVKFDIVLLKGKEFIRAYKVHSVPLTVLIGTSGTVVESWQGLLNVEEMEEIEDMIGRNSTAEVNQ